MAPPCEWITSWHFLLFAGFGLKILPQLNIKAVQNLKTKSSSIILTPRDYVLPVSTFLLFWFLGERVKNKLLVFLAFLAAFFCKFCHN